MATKDVAEMSEEDLLDRWRTHIAKIGDEWIFVLQNRTRYRAVDRALARALPKRGRTDQTRGWLTMLWGTDAIMAVRRELDDQQGVINLRHLLYELEQRPDIANRRRFMEYGCPSVCWCWYPEKKAIAKARFDSFPLVTFEPENEWDQGERDYINPLSVVADRRTIETEAGEAFRYAQRLVAHRTPVKDFDITPTAINQALDCIWTMVQKYYLFLSTEPLRPKTPRPPKGWNRELTDTLRVQVLDRDDAGAA